MAVGATLAWSGSATAETTPTDYRVTNYHAELAVFGNGTLAVTETIVVDFSSSPHHGIFRNIQTRYRYDDVKPDYDRVTPLSIVSVEGSPGTPAQYSQKTQGDETVLKIGDPGRTITGSHTYTIRFQVRGVLNHFTDHDELYWNVVGLGWDVPIDQASATLDLPGPAQKVACFTGPKGSTLPCSDGTSAGSVARFAQSRLGAHQGLTIVAGVPPGVVSPTPRPILEQRWTFQRAFALRPDTVIPAGGLAAAAIAGFGVLVWRKGRDERFVGGAADVAFGRDGGPTERVPMHGNDPIPVEFAPPENLRPGQVGTLIDETANTLDVTATIVDLAVRGYLKITEIPKEHWFSHADWELTRLANNDRLKVYERTLLTGLFKSGGTVKLSDLKDHFHTTLVKVEDELYANTVRNGWFRSRPDKERTRWKLVGIAVLVVGVALTFLLAATTSFGLLGLPVVVLGLLLTAGARAFPRRTAKGYGTLRRVLGFKRFIDESEKERAQFAERQNLFSEYLPYAVVFGATEKWAKAFAGTDGQLPATNWYVGTNAFTIATFGSAMNSFAVTTSGTIASTPASSGSSGFGGGGFSGGGFGGGGGGAW